MKLTKTNILTDIQLSDVETFLSTCSFNAEINFTENDINYYEDFPCFYIYTENDALSAFASCFIPDETLCEIYFHINNSECSMAKKIFNTFISDIKTQLKDFDIKDTYFLFDSHTKVPIYITDILSFSHSECLMQYDLSYASDINTNLSFFKTTGEDEITIETFLNDIPIGSCKIEVSSDYALIHNVFIKENYRSMGYGTETLLITLNTLKELNYKKIMLHVNNANTPAFAMYSHHGFFIKQQIDYWYLF